MRSRPVAGVISCFSAGASRIRAKARSRSRPFVGLVAIAAITVLLFTACNPGFVTSVAGNGTAGNSGDGGQATAASFEQPGSIAVLPDGSYDVLDVRACVIRHVSVSGTISTIAGTGTCGYSGDGGPATSAQIQPAVFDLTPSGQLAVDPAGNLYLADGGNRRIRRVATDGTITTVAGDGAGNCADGGSEVIPEYLAFGPDGTFYVGCGNGVFKVMPDGSLQVLISITAAFTFLSAMTVDQAGNIYYADNTGLVHKRTLNGTVTNFANVPNLGFVQTLPSGFGNQVVVGINGLSVGPDGSVYAALGPVLQTDLRIDSLAGIFSYDAVLRLGQGTARLIAGTNGSDPGTGTQSGYGPQLAITPYGIAATANNALLISSGHNVYTLQEANTAQPWSGTPCTNFVIPSGTDLSNINLAGLDLFRCVIVGVNFSNTNLSGANLQHAILANDNFSGANLSGANLAGAGLANDNLTGTDLSGATLDGARATGIIGQPAALPAGSYVTAGVLVPPNHDLSGMNLSGLDLTGADFAGVNLSGADLSGAILTNASLSGANLTNAKLGNTSLTGVDLSGANLTNVQLSSLNLTGVDLSGADLTNAQLNSTNLTSADLSDASLTGTTLRSATVANTNFAGATATSVVANTLTGIPANTPLGVEFRTDATATHGAFLYPGVNLGGANASSAADLDGVDLSGIDLTGANLSSASLKSANLANTNLTNANLTFADFTGATGTPVGADTATYSFTICPDGSSSAVVNTCVGHGF